MKRMYTSKIVALVLVAFLGVALWMVNRGYSSIGFAGSSFHAESAEDCSLIYSKFKSFLISEGFRQTPSSSEFTSRTGVQNENGKRLWFTRSASRHENLCITVNFDANSMHTHVEWDHYGFDSGADKAELEALRFALKVENWMSERPENNKLPERLRVEQVEWFEMEIAKLEEG